MDRLERSRISAEIRFLTAEEGGRRQAPHIAPSAHYMPHLVVQARDVRRATHAADGSISDLYQGVRFLEGPPDLQLGRPGRFVLDLMYYPGVPYADVLPGATFTVREGGKVVADGVVLSREDPQVERLPSS